MTLPDTRCEIAFIKDPGNGSPLWRDVSDDVEWWQGVSISRRRSHELDEVQPGTLSLVLSNESGDYTAGNSASVHYPNVRINRPIRIRARWPVSANLLLEKQAKGSDTSLFAASQGTLAQEASIVPAGQTTSIRWAAGTLPIGAQMRVGSTPTTSATDQAIPVQPGVTYSIRCQARRDASVAVTMAVRLRYFTADGLPQFDVTGTGVAMTTAFQPLSLSTTAPAGAAFARVVLHCTVASASAVVIYSSAWQVEEAAAPSAWVSPGIEYIRYTGYVDKWPHAWANGVLGVVSITATDRQKLLGRQNLGATALIDGQQSGARATALLTAAGVTSMSVDAGLSILGLTGAEATANLQSLLQATATSEAGLFFVGCDGVPVFQDRARRQKPSTTVLTITADQCGPDLSFVVDDALLANDVTVLLDDGAAGAPQQNATSIGDYGTYSKRLNTLLTTTVEANDRALYLLGKYAEPNPRASQISIEANSQPALWPALLGSEIGQRIQVTSLPSNAPSGTLDLWVEGVQDTITDQTWTFTLDPSPAAVTISFILDDSTYGKLDSNRLGW